MKASKKSLAKFQKSVETMCGGTFHHHVHILADLFDGGEYLEIGSYQGGSALAASQKPCRMTLVDAGIYNKGCIEQNLKGKDYRLLIGDSKQVDFYDRTYDLIFIDGDHSMQGVFADWNNTKALIKEGGCIAFDDYGDKQYCPEVKMAVDQIDFTGFEVIGQLPNIGAYPVTELNNIFIVRKNKACES
jgi:predicted O-methyltransferase YrrM